MCVIFDGSTYSIYINTTLKDHLITLFKVYTSHFKICKYRVNGTIDT